MARNSEQDVTPVVIEPLSDDEPNVDNVAVRDFLLDDTVKWQQRFQKLWKLCQSLGPASSDFNWSRRK